MIPTLPRQRIVAGTAATLEWQPTDSDGEPADPGDVTVAVTRSTGAEVVAAGTAPSGAGDNKRSITVTPDQTEQLDWLTHTWTNADDVVIGREVAEVAGPPLCTWAEFVGRETSTSDSDKPLFFEARRQVEWMFTIACRRAFTPRFYVQRSHVIPGKGVLLTWPEVRAIRWVRYYPTTDLTNYTELSASEVADLVVDSEGRIGRYETSPAVNVTVNTSGWRNGQVAIGYEYGLDRPPDDLKAAVMAAIRIQIQAPTRASQDHAISWTDPSGSTYQLPTPGLGDWVTGVPLIDEPVKRYRYRHWLERQ